MQSSRDRSGLIRAIRRAVWVAGDVIGAVVSAVTNFRVPDEPLQPFAQKLPMLLGYYERDIQAELRKIITPGMVVIDGGAHAGFYTRIFSRLVGPGGQVIAFEIHPTNAALLKANVRHMRNVEVIEAAIGPSDGHAILMQHTTGSAGHSIARGKPGLTAAGEIPMRSLPSVLRERGLARADFVKLDIEGSEPEVMSSLRPHLGALRPFHAMVEAKRYILAGSGTTPEAFVGALLDDGYSVRPAEGGPALHHPLSLPDKNNLMLYMGE